MLKFDANQQTNRQACPWQPCFQPTRTIFKLVQDIIVTNLFTKFYDDWTINVACRVITCFYYSNLRKNALPPCSHVFQPTETFFRTRPRHDWKISSDNIL
ncbi:hypothetical protein DPMN_006254 [Dreissena polymorpha]|uniref:Uncharacterized protein n=1 Tax=Dreissena polymorpha TaxID=45954 RepID=A0A9D4MUX2_DREPO|nr:hypothetical protein DPMN_006254 [Dreissena polymorpha]